MINYCMITGLSVSASSAFPEVVSGCTIHPFFSLSESEVLKLFRERKKGKAAEDLEARKLFSPSEALLLAFFPLVRMGKVDVKQGAIPSEVVLTSKSHLYTAALCSLRLVSLLSALNDRQLKRLKAEVPTLIAAKQSIKSILEMLEELETSIQVLSYPISELDKLHIQVNAKALSNESASFVKSYMNSISVADHIVTIGEMKELYPEHFTLDLSVYTWMLKTGTNDPARLASKEWAERLNNLQSTLIEVLDINGARALRSTALIMYLNNAIQNVATAYALEIKGAYEIAEIMTSTANYTKKGISVTMLSVESVDELDLAVEVPEAKPQVITRKLPFNSEVTDRLREVVAKRAKAINAAAEKGES